MPMSACTGRGEKRKRNPPGMHCSRRRVMGMGSKSTTERVSNSARPDCTSCTFITANEESQWKSHYAVFSRLFTAWDSAHCICLHAPAQSWSYTAATRLLPRYPLPQEMRHFSAFISSQWLHSHGLLCLPAHTSFTPGIAQPHRQELPTLRPSRRGC